MWHMYEYVLKYPFIQDGHDRLNMEKQLPYFYTDNFSRYRIVGLLSQRELSCRAYFYKLQRPNSHGSFGYENH